MILVWIKDYIGGCKNKKDNNDILKVCFGTARNITDSFREKEFQVLLKTNLLCICIGMKMYNLVCIYKIYWWTELDCVGTCFTIPLQGKLFFGGKCECPWD